MVSVIWMESSWQVRAYKGFIDFSPCLLGGSAYSDYLEKDGAIVNWAAGHIRRVLARFHLCLDLSDSFNPSLREIPCIERKR